MDFIYIGIVLLFAIILYKLTRQVRKLTKYRKNTESVAKCLSQPNSMVVGNGTNDLSKLKCIRGDDFKSIVDRYSLGMVAYPLKNCIEDNTNFRLMVNAVGQQVCLSARDSMEVSNDVAIASLVKDCLIDDNQQLDTTKMFTVDQYGMPSCSDIPSMTTQSPSTQSPSTQTPI